MNCGKTINDVFLYCPYCGIAIEKSIKIVSRFRSLNEKNKEELIKIILRKDKTERNLNRKIQELINELKYYKGLNNREL